MTVLAAIGRSRYTDTDGNLAVWQTRRFAGLDTFGGLRWFHVGACPVAAKGHRTFRDAGACYAASRPAR